MNVLKSAAYPYNTINGKDFLAGNFGLCFHFNGKENDDEIKGQGNSCNFDSRIYDTRIGRWLSRDPDESKYPDQSTYSYSFNCPLYFNDPTGKGGRETVTEEIHKVTGKPIIKVTANIYIHNDNIINLAGYTKSIKENIESQWNNPIKINADGSTTPTLPSTRYNGKEYTIVFEVNVIPITDAESEAKEKKAKEIFLKHVDENFVKLELGDGASNMSGGNSGTWYMGQDNQTCNSTFAQEFGHIIGFADHPIVVDEVPNDNSSHIQSGEPGFGISIMSSIVDNYFDKSNSATITNFDYSQRQVTVNDIEGRNYGNGINSSINPPGAVSTGRDANKSKVYGDKPTTEGRK